MVSGGPVVLWGAARVTSGSAIAFRGERKIATTKKDKLAQCAPTREKRKPSWHVPREKLSS